MEAVRKKHIYDLFRISLFSIPAVVAIFISELITLIVYLFKPPETDNFFALWRALQLIPVFIFAYISDRQYRKGALVISHILGLILGVAVYLLGFPFWALIVVSLAFSPIPVARAALLDNFPQYSSVKLVAITYFAMYIPWMFFYQFSFVSLNKLIIFTFFLLLINTLMTIVLFRDRKDLTHVDHSLHRTLATQNKKKMILMIVAFILSQITFELIWDLLYRSHAENVWVSLMNCGFVIGFAGAILYKKLPHMSIIMLTYTTGLGISIVATIGNWYGLFGCQEAILTSMGYYTVVAGVYLPLVTDGVISLFNPQKKATASAVVELAARLASILWYVGLFYVLENYCHSLYFISLLFLLAALLQRRVEKLHAA